MQDVQLICDAAELSGIWGAAIPDIIVITGFTLPSDDVRALVQKTRYIKKHLAGDSLAPVKWNMKDVVRACKLHGLSHLRGQLVQKSDHIRAELLKVLCKLDAKIFVSVILAYSNRKQVLGRTKQDLVGFSFGNLLMRVGLSLAEAKTHKKVQVLLDWPEGSRRDPFIHEYHSAWKHGKSYGSAAKYKCGALSAIGFDSAPVFGVTDLDERLQIADLVTGAARVFINFCLGKVSQDDFGMRAFTTVCANLDRSAAGHPFGRGLTVSPTNSQFSKTLLSGLKKVSC
jgi:hypothetical protein